VTIPTAPRLTKTVKVFVTDLLKRTCVECVAEPVIHVNQGPVIHLRMYAIAKGCVGVTRLSMHVRFAGAMV
jgi:hypothetical protein